MAETETRPLRMCDSCGGVDTHPRHVFWEGPASSGTSDQTAFKALEAAAGNTDATIGVLRHVRDTETTMKHLDCCRADGCPDGTCDQVTAGAEDLRGDDLLAHLTKES